MLQVMRRRAAAECHLDQAESMVEDRRAGVPPLGAARLRVGPPRHGGGQQPPKARERARDAVGKRGGQRLGRGPRRAWEPADGMRGEWDAVSGERDAVSGERDAVSGER